MKSLSALFLSLVFSMSGFASHELTPTQAHVLADLDTIHEAFAVKYAPLKWKGEFANWDLDQAVQHAKNRVETLSNPTLKECQGIIRDFFNSTRDYHVGVFFYSSECASLPFTVKGVENRYFVCDVDSDALFPFEDGDELLTFDGRPIHDVIEELRASELGLNTYETDKALAEKLLTYRRGSKGHQVPSGSVTVTGIKQEMNEEASVTLEWVYEPERVKDTSQITSSVPFKERATSRERRFFDKFMLFHDWDPTSVKMLNPEGRHDMGSRVSCLPPLGKKVWQSSSNGFFDAYIFETERGRRVGYIRIPHYMCDEEEFEEFGALVNYFESRTKALVIDQLNNPGGSVFYLYALASTLTHKPLYAPKHHIALTQEEVHSALNFLSVLEHVNDDASARTYIGETIGGYHVDLDFATLLKKFCTFMLDEWSKGKFYTSTTHLFGVDKIKPHPHYRYTKPLLLLTNSLDFSGGDFFPAILQDNKRAKIMGGRTAGAGGYVLEMEHPNLSGIEHFQLTGSLAERINRQPIENLGVKPDIPYELTVEDLQDGYRPYSQAILREVQKLIK